MNFNEVNTSQQIHAECRSVFLQKTCEEKHLFAAVRLHNLVQELKGERNTEGIKISQWTVRV